MSLFTPATRRAVKLKLAIQGPSGSGKTLGALALAQGLALAGKVAVIDTENGSASLYADRFTFDTLNLQPPYTSARYLEAITAAAQAGYAVVVIDSLSHEWVGEGSILSRKESDDAKPGANSYTNWGKYTKEHEGFKAGILGAPIHVIATMRAKQDYILETNDRGKQQPRKIGLAPIQREGMEYEFTTVWEVAMNHKATTSKDRTGLFGDESVDLLSTALPKRLLDWLGSAKPAEVSQEAERGGTSTAAQSKGTAAGAGSHPAPTTPLRSPDTTPLSQKPRALEAPEPDPLKGEELDPPTWPFGSERGRTLKSYDSDALVLKRNWLVKKSRKPEEFAELVDAIDTELSSREGL